jgi:hypothetical protein
VGKAGYSDLGTLIDRKTGFKREDVLIGIYDTGKEWCI